MAATGIWTIPHGTLAVGVEFIMPDGFWVVPTNASNMTFVWNGLTSGGVLDGSHTVNITLINRNITAGTDASTRPDGPVDTTSFITAIGHNGSDIFTGAFKITSAPSGLPDHANIQVTAYSGAAHAVEFIRRSGAWAGIDGTHDFVWRSGAWVAVPEEQVWRSGAWKQV